MCFKHYDRSTFRLYSVGQGLFSAGFLHEGLGKQPVFTWVYDCGTSSAGGVDLHRFEQDCCGRHIIDLLVISHYHRDHISGISELLRRFTVRDIVLPFQPLDERLWSAFAQDVDFDSLEMSFFISPLQFIRELSGGARAGFTLVTAPWQEFAGEPNSTDQTQLHYREESGNETEPSAHLDEGDQSVSSEPQKYRESRVVSSGCTLLFLRDWEFVSLRNDKPSSCDASFRLLVHDRRESLVSWQGRTETLSDLKQLYDQKRSGHQAINSASIILYAGPQPARRPHALALTTSVPNIPSIRFPNVGDGYHLSRLAKMSRTGILHSGDARLKTEEDWKELRKHLLERLGQVGVLQVPHHGSADNYKNLHPDFDPHSLVVSCGADNSYGHPSTELIASSITPFILSPSDDFEETWCFLTKEPASEGLLEWLAEQVIEISQLDSENEQTTTSIKSAIRSGLPSVDEHELDEKSRRYFLTSWSFLNRSFSAVRRSLAKVRSPPSK